MQTPIFELTLHQEPCPDFIWKADDAMTWFVAAVTLGIVGNNV